MRCLAGPSRGSRVGIAACAIVASLFATPAWGSGEAVQSGAYAIVVQTVMPHLEENLRYATTRARRCLGRDTLASVFPILQHPSLDGCRLGDVKEDGGRLRALLVCENPQVATGSAWWDASADRIAGVLEIKMGGKNMTFSQRVAATREGGCDGSP